MLCSGLVCVAVKVGDKDEVNGMRLDRWCDGTLKKERQRMPVFNDDCPCFH